MNHSNYSYAAAQLGKQFNFRGSTWTVQLFGHENVVIVSDKEITDTLTRKKYEDLIQDLDNP